jgi:hypothetical protein
VFAFAVMPPKPKVRNSDSKKESSANALVDNTFKDFFKRKRGDRKSSGSSDTLVSNSPKKIKAGASMERSIEEEKMEHMAGGTIVTVFQPTLWRIRQLRTVKLSA